GLLDYGEGTEQAKEFPVIMRANIIKYCDVTVEWSLYLLIFCLPFAKAGVSIFSVLAIIAWLGKRIAGFRADGFKGMIPATPLQKALVAFIIVNALSVMFSVDVSLSLEAFFRKMIKFIIIFFMVAETINTEKRVKRFLWVMMASAVLMALDAGAQYFNGIDFLRNNVFENRLKASFSAENGFAGWLIVFILVLLGYRKERSCRPFLGVLILALVGALTACLILTYTRGAWLGFFVGLLLMTGYIFVNATWKEKGVQVVVAIALIAGFMLLPPSVKAKLNSVGQVKFIYNETLVDRLKSILKKDDTSNSIRFRLWKESVRIIRDYPLTGCGLNTYSVVAREYKSFEGGGIYPHNSYLQMAAEIGPLGLCTFFLILYGFFRMSLIYLKQHQDYLVMGIFSGLLGFLIQACFDTHLYSLQMVVLFWFMLGLGTAVIKMRVSSP
ncbi:MAG TPA: O-antigen ligase family protein, partial [Candidatus Bathyarchaeia archaeon]|nr:O-antigen ligase family protein [Candidatus Bathyarchaeia archaeon]